MYVYNLQIRIRDLENLSDLGMRLFYQLQLLIISQYSSLNISVKTNLLKANDSLIGSHYLYVLRTDIWKWVNGCEISLSSFNSIFHVE